MFVQCPICTDDVDAEVVDVETLKCPYCGSEIDPPGGRPIISRLGETQRRLVDEMIRNGGIIYTSDAVRTIDYTGRFRSATVGPALSALHRLRRRRIVRQLYGLAGDVAGLIEAGELRVLDPARAVAYLRSHPRGLSWWILDPDALE